MALTLPPFPGVFVQEVPSQVTSITGASTSTAAFIGVTAAATVNLVAKNLTFDPTAASGTPAALKYKFVQHTMPTADKVPVLITSWAQFVRAFGDLMGDPSETAATGSPTAADADYMKFAQAVYGFFNNGGTRCYVARVLNATAAADMDTVLAAFAAIDEISIVAAPGQTSSAILGKLITHCANTGDRFAILDSPQNDTVATVQTDEPGKTDVAAIYFPWINVFDPGTSLIGTVSDGSLAVPPSGHIAGIYARVDTQRGVFKSPASEVVRGALSATVPLSQADSGTLNPKGINALRNISGNIVVWGARTVGGDANGDLRYISVRRTLLFLRDSLMAGTQWAVFEPNTPALWAKVSRNVTAFLTNAWRSGALFGSTPQEAFFVKVDGENNPPDQRNQGALVIDVGVAIARPAEFVIFRLSQSAPTK